MGNKIRKFVANTIMNISAITFWAGILVVLIATGMSDANATWSETKTFYIVGILLLVWTAVASNIAWVKKWSD